MTRVTTITAGETMRRKIALEARLKEFQGAFRECEDLPIECLPDLIDQVSSTMERELAFQRLDHKARLIQEIESSLAGLEGRLWALWTLRRANSSKAPGRCSLGPLCVECQSEVEGANHDAKPTVEDAA